MKLPNFSYENEVWARGFKSVAGVDEVGRGSFAGPVVAAAVVFPQNSKFVIQNSELVYINDSKKLSQKQREVADIWIREHALCFGIGSASVGEINKVGIKKATETAFRRAIRDINRKLKYPSIEYLLIDAFNIPHIPRLRRDRQNAIIKGDTKSFSIAAASIIAKVYRDKIMTDLSKQSKFKRYQWAMNKGYGTKKHIESILRHGISNYHRKQFVKTYLGRI